MCNGQCFLQKALKTSKENEKNSTVNGRVDFANFKEAQQHENTKKFIDEEILPSMESLLWHPTLTYQTTFHTDHYYHQS